MTDPRYPNGRCQVCGNGLHDDGIGTVECITPDCSASPYGHLDPCDDCGLPFTITTDGIACHAVGDGRGNDRFDVDADHVPYALANA